MKYVNKEVMKTVGNAGYRIGKDIVREGTKVVVGKTLAAAIGGLITDKWDGVKSLTLDDVLGDLTRQSRKAERKAIRMLRKQGASKEEAKEIIKKEMEEAQEIVKESVKDFNDDEKKVTE